MTTKSAANLEVGDRIPVRNGIYPIVAVKPVNRYGKRIVMVDANLMTSEGEPMFAPVILSADAVVEVSA